MKSLILLFFSALLCTAVSAHDFVVDGIYYYITSSSDLTVSVTYRGSDYDSYSDEYSGSVVIPEKVTYDSKKYSVTSIGEYAFSGCSGLTSVTTPNSVTSIGTNAFLGTGWYNNQSDGVLYLDNWLIDYKGTMPANTSINIKDGTKGIAGRAFSGCSGLTSITIPNSVTSIGDMAFLSCSGITSVTIPNSVTSIGQAAFGGCSGLTAVHITDLSAWCKIKFDSYNSNPTFYAHHLYLNGEEITNLVIPDNVTTIGSSAFSGCSGLTSITIPNSVTSIGDSAFRHCSGLTSVTIGNSVTSIGYEAFYDCKGLTSVTIGNSVTSIGDEAFNGCSGLTAVYITDLSAWCKIKFDVFFSNPTEYAHHLYLNGEEIINLVIPDNVTTIGSSAFSGCSGLTSITIPNSVTSIGDMAFLSCSGITSVAIPNSVTSIGYETFSGCSGLTSVTIPNSVTSIGRAAFSRCSGLTSVTIPNSVTSIGRAAFSRCSGLTSVTIGKSVASIEKTAFEKCDSITRIDCQAETPPTAYSNTFSNEIYTKATLNVLEGCVEAYKSADVWKEFTNISVLGASTGIKQIESAAASSYIYDINGNRIEKNCDEINNLKRGIYIIGGKKVYIR